MANGRFISRTIATDKRLSQLSLESEYLFLKTVPHLDRDGLILADVLWSTVTPRRLTLAGVAEDLWREWVKRDLAIAYETDEGTVLYFPGFAKNQQGMRYEREAPSRYAPPPGFIRTDTGLTPITSPDQLPTNSGPTPPQGQEQEQVQEQVQEQQQQQGQEQGEPPADQDKPPADKNLVVVAMKGIGILESSHAAILKAWPDITPDDVTAWGMYLQNSNTCRNGNALSPAFVVGEMKARRKAPDDCYLISDPDDLPAIVLE